MISLPPQPYSANRVELKQLVSSSEEIIGYAITRYVCGSRVREIQIMRYCPAVRAILSQPESVVYPILIPEKEQEKKELLFLIYPSKTNRRINKLNPHPDDLKNRQIPKDLGEILLLTAKRKAEDELSRLREDHPGAQLVDTSDNHSFALS